MAGLGGAWHGRVRHGAAGLGSAGQGEGQGTAWRGLARQGRARIVARLGRAGLGLAWQGWEQRIMASVVRCLPQKGKSKARKVCEAFAVGAGGQVVEPYPATLPPGPVMFYGVRPAWQHLHRQAVSEGRAWYLADNGFFGREVYFRIAKNAVQAAQCPPDHERLAVHGIEIQPWRQDGRHIVVALQSDEFMETVAGWTGDLAAWARERTDRPIRIRRKYDETPLADDLRGAWALVTWSSNAAVEAICAGIPAIALGESVAPEGQDIEAPPMEFDRVAWAARLAASQWTLKEMRQGLAWRALREVEG